MKKIRNGARKSPWFRRFFLFILFLFPFLVVSAGLYLYVIIRDLPDIHNLKDYRPSITTRIYSDNDRLIDEFFLEDRRFIPINKVPKYVAQAFIAAEDSRFFQHEGVDFYGMVRAFVKNVTHGAIVQGGSTITQQLAKAIYLSPERSLTRKIKEAVLAYRMDRYLKKYEILNLYLNQIYLGHGTYGIEAASQCYFGKSARDLNLAEAALLAGLPKAPSRYSPFVSLEKAKQRQAYTLNRMVEEGYITEAEKERAEKMPIRLNTAGPKGKVAPYFTENVRRYIVAKYGSEALYKEGLEVYTTLNFEMQQAATAAVERGLQELEKREGTRVSIRRVPAAKVDQFTAQVEKEISKKPLEKGQVVRALVESVDEGDRVVHLRVGRRKAVASFDHIHLAANAVQAAEMGKMYNPAGLFSPGDVVEARLSEKPQKEPLELSIELHPAVQAALLCMDARTGEIKAMVGGRDFRRSEFNRATQSRRQPGSAFKPLIYAAAFDKGLTPATIVMDSPVVFKDSLGDTDWRPKNFDAKYHGPTTLRDALVYSRNVVTIKVLKDIGVRYAVDYARNMGIESPLSENLSLALGTSGVTVQEMVRAFGVLANEGKKAEPYFIRKIVDRTGSIFEEHAPRVEPVIDAKVAYITTSVLQDVVQRGTGWRVRAIGKPVAGKTGTTDEYKDAWFIGYTPSFVAGVWVGYDDGRPLGKAEVGGVAAAPIWLYFMEKALAGQPVENFRVPEGIVFVKIDPKTGLLASPFSSDARTECFLEGTAPTEYAPSDLERWFMKNFGGAPAKESEKEDLD
ncbi:MAG TPA: PBP1A family penicillin-binding protein [Syntrophales bacterium]|nr:PBP1A family penicillin-binding protein [Syntrophobacterales bacterium]HRT26640.1 PBP1A family penicillin-binding protein [Syntrophales bacterium]HRT69747.1 PBP1A family penicillin-binding protein [Syntrophales bacterium]